MIGMKINDTNHSSPCLERCNVARDRDFDDVGQMKMEIVVMSPMLLKMMVMISPSYSREGDKKFDSLWSSFLLLVHLRGGELLRRRQIGQNWARARNQKWPKSQ